MILAFGFIGALFVTMVLVPPLMRMAGPMRLLDVPDERKVHTHLVPRCGGLAIASGVLLPLLMWMPREAAMSGLLAGALVVFLFGLWDDVKDLDYKVKLLGQLVGIVVAVKAGILLQHFPLAGLDPVSPWLAYPVTVLFLLGITNAVNLSDGLDGLAAGCIMITLGMIAFLAYQADGDVVVLLAITVMGAILGFLRYNTHPAIVFLGDAGSQFLGFIAATLTIYLVERVNTALSPALPLLLLGLPILDTLWVMTVRIANGRSPFVADRNHIHHRLLRLGFKHYEAVSLIYVMHGFLICSAFYLRYQSDLLIIAVFVVFALGVVGMTLLGEATGWRLRADEVRQAQEPALERRTLWLRKRTWLPLATTRYLSGAVAVFLVVGAVLAERVPRDFVVVSASAVIMLLVGNLVLRGGQRIFTRAGVYLASVLVVFLLAQGEEMNDVVGLCINTYLVVASVVLVIGIRVTRRDLFRVTPQDLLIVFFALVVPNLTSDYLSQYPIGEITFRLLVLFYVTEFLLTKEQDEFLVAETTGRLTMQTSGVLRYSALICLCILALRGQF